MEEVVEVVSIPVTPKTPRTEAATPPISAPPSNLHSPSLTRSPLLPPSLPKTPRTPRFITPLASPMRKVILNMRSYLEDMGHLTKLDPQDAWLPITESRNGNAFYAAFHSVTAGIGVQALVLPLAFTFLGWTWGILCLSFAFFWQLYTLWILTQLHESVPGTRYGRYIQLSKVAFGEKLGNWLALFPTMYLSAGTCTALIIIGGGSMKLFFEIVCGATCRSQPLTAIEWYLVFTCLAVVLSQLPNLNSIAGVSLIGALSAVGYCTLIWVVSVGKGRPAGISYEASRARSDVARVFGILNALGIIAFAFRGHNLALEIQSTMPSTLKHPSHIPMWRGVKFAYLVIGMCLFPVAIGGYWAYGNLIPPNGILTALYQFHSRDTSQAVLGLTSLLVVINCLSSFQIYAMPVFDNMESGYTSKHNKPCPWWLRSGFRAFFGAVSLFIAAAFPFLSSLAGLIGGIALPVTLAYPCFMWIAIKKPERYSALWYINWGLGSSGMVLSVLLVAGGVWSILDTGFKLRFFKPQ
ncbi:Lysine histidine transporter-like 8 [Asimina triloba]